MLPAMMNHLAVLPPDCHPSPSSPACTGPSGGLFDSYLLGNNNGQIRLLAARDCGVFVVCQARCVNAAPINSFNPPDDP